MITKNLDISHCLCKPLVRVIHHTLRWTSSWILSYFCQIKQSLISRTLRRNEIFMNISFLSYHAWKAGNWKCSCIFNRMMKQPNENQLHITFMNIWCVPVSEKKTLRTTVWHLTKIASIAFIETECRPRFNINTIFPFIDVSIITIRESWNSLINILNISIK